MKKTVENVRGEGGLRPTGTKGRNRSPYEQNRKDFVKNHYRENRRQGDHIHNLPSGGEETRRDHRKSDPPPKKTTDRLKLSTGQERGTFFNKRHPEKTGNYFI